MIKIYSDNACTNQLIQPYFTQMPDIYVYRYTPYKSHIDIDLSLVISEIRFMFIISNTSIISFLPEEFSISADRKRVYFYNEGHTKIWQVTGGNQYNSTLAVGFSFTQDRSLNVLNSSTGQIVRQQLWIKNTAKLIHNNISIISLNNNTGEAKDRYVSRFNVRITNGALPETFTFLSSSIQYAVISNSTYLGLLHSDKKTIIGSSHTDQWPTTIYIVRVGNIKFLDIDWQVALSGIRLLPNEIKQIDLQFTSVSILQSRYLDTIKVFSNEENI